MTHEDEDKLAAMREYIWKLSRSRQSARPKGREEEAEGINKVRLLLGINVSLKRKSDCVRRSCFYLGWFC